MADLFDLFLVFQTEHLVDYLALHPHFGDQVVDWSVVVDVDERDGLL